MLKLARDWLMRAWWGSLIAYPILLIGSFLAIWAVLEPAGIPDELPAPVWPWNTRLVLHIVLAILLASNAVIGLDLWRRRSLQSSGPMRVYDSREAIYRAVVAAINAVDSNPAVSKTLFLGALHGHSGQRLPSEEAPNASFAEFDSALLRCVKSTGPQMWRVRELYNIGSLDRLNEVERRLRRTAVEDGYEVRAFCEPGSIANLAPLIIGESLVFLAMEDDRYFRVQAGLGSEDRNAAAFVKRYCESLWNDRRAVTLRAGNGIDEAGLRALRARLAEVEGANA
jgi:hypothetical protein